MNCIFCCVFNDEKYVDMFFILLESLLVYGKLDENTQLLIYTSTEFMNIIKKNELYNENIVFEINDTYNNIDKSCKARLDVFELPSISNYEKILYLDTDILIKGTINNVFNVCKQDILYVLEEGIITDKRDFYGLTLFGNTIHNYNNKTAFTSGILLFNNCETIKKLFYNTKEDIIKRPYNFSCYDQPYIVYNAFKYNLYNNKLLQSYAVNNNINIHSNKIIHHFPGYPGVYTHKINIMTTFLNKLNNHNFKNRIKIYDTKIITTNKSINNKLSIIGICISYKYFDTLQFMLPINHAHFEKLYIVTQPDDLQTINFCKQFNNVIVLFYDFKNNNKTFDKYGALSYTQNIVYSQFPESWYLIIDSDIILPYNLIDILEKTELNSECIYGAIRINVLKSSELLNKKEIVNKNIDWQYNNIIQLKNKPPSILGCFQLYKKHAFCRNDINNAGNGDYYFGYDNFNVFCNIDNIIYFHLGKSGVNWDGKVDSFINDIDISLSNIYYKCHKSINCIYYNKNCQLVKYGNSKNIDNDLWTCSEKMRYDIYDFFKSKPLFKIAEIGSDKGYTTKVLANIFSKVYAVDNNINSINFNKEYNKGTKNIEYVLLDLYKDSWEVLPEDIEVTFIDALHTYDACKSDIMHSIKRFKNLQYIIFDDYGVWKGVRKIIDELINNKILVFERFIGITDVPGPKGVVKNVHEGIICSINKSINKNTKINPNKNTFNNKPTTLVKKNTIQMTFF
uniref:Methyltransferase domain-containing protein n=1 Tax=viral metagenome TaxID=1070528 RepID=A0A6C0IR77_9ZZZZ